MHSIRTGIIALFLGGVLLVPNANAQSASVADMLKIIEDLKEQILELQKKLQETRGELRETLRAGLEEGMSDEDIRKIQEVLATDPSIYPEGLVTGYYGPRTREALMRFQERHELEVTGKLDDDTRKLLEEYLVEKFGGKIPPGLLRAPGIIDKIEGRFIRVRCDNSHGSSVCERLKIKYRDQDDDSDEDDSNDEDSDDNDSDDSNDDNNEELKDAAEDAIEDAHDAIADANDAIDEVNGDTDDAEALITSALAELAEAEEAFDEEEYAEAIEHADAAKELAEEADDEVS